MSFNLTWLSRSGAPRALQAPAGFGSAESAAASGKSEGGQRKILLLSVSAGAGHVRAAQAIAAHGAQRSCLAATHLDVMDFVPSGFRKVYTDLYLRLITRHPQVWRMLYQVSNDADANGAMEKLRRLVERVNTRRLLRRIADEAPDAIVCTHFLPAEILSRAIGRASIACPVWVQVTDFDLHRMWVHEHVSGYFVASEEIAYRMRAQGIAAQRIHVTGIPVMPAFGQAPSRQACAHEFGLDPAKTTLLLMGGGAGVGRLELVTERLLALDADFQIVALAGKNADALATLQRLAAHYPQRLFPMGFTDRIPQLMACADVAVTKPGGLTTAECLAMGLPMIVNAPIPGQEERNADYLLEQGAALKALDAVTLEYRVRQLLDDPAQLAAMRDKARRLGRPDAAAKVLDHVLDNLPHPVSFS